MGGSNEKEMSAMSDEDAQPADELEDLIAIARAADALAQDEEAFREAAEAYKLGDAARFGAALEAVGREDDCERICHFFCVKRCNAVCYRFCPDRPAEPSIAPFQVPVPDPPSGVGDHPIGASSWLMGQFNMATAVEYKVEVATSPGGLYGPISEPVSGYNGSPPLPPWPTRSPSGGADPG